MTWQQKVTEGLLWANVFFLVLQLPASDVLNQYAAVGNGIAALWMWKEAA